MIDALYTNTASCIRVDGNTSESFQVRSEVRQGCVLVPDSFDVAMDWVLERSTSIAMQGVSMGNENFSDLDYADDVGLLTELMELLQSALEVFATEAAPIELVVNWKKTKFSLSVIILPPIGDLDTGGEQVEAITSFTYLGATTHSSCKSGQELRGMNHILGRDWHITPKSDFTMSALCSSISMLLSLAL